LGSKQASQKEKAVIVTELRHNHNLKHLLHLAGLARSSYYYHTKSISFLDKHVNLVKHVIDIYNKHKGLYGYRRITLALRKELGIPVNFKTIAKIMKKSNLKSIIRVKKYRSFRGDVGKTAENILQRNFKATEPDQKWATDVTEFNVKGNKLYLSPIIDLFNGEIISYNLSTSPNYKQTSDMLDKAFKKRKKESKAHIQTILHSDQGWQYRLQKYQHKLKANNIIQSMSRKGNCLDNAIIENFFGVLKSELFYLKKYTSIIELSKEIKDYIKYYNNDRIRINLNGMSPIEYRAHYIKNIA
ncbi:IS3 family transposase, partial [Myroides marinus]|uniref:IS3 family transposase n=1 Tax=Myroides marinus TaxID=703342 RepID=UPI0025771FAC